MMPRALLPALLLPAVAVAFVSQHGRCLEVAQEGLLFPRAVSHCAKRRPSPVHQHNAMPVKSTTSTSTTSTTNIAVSRRRRARARGVALSMGSKKKQKGGVAVSRDQDVAELLRWSSEEIGVKAPNLKGGFIEGLRGLIATQSIKSNDEIVVVPSDSALVTTTDQLCPFRDWIDSKYWAKSPWQVRLGLLLLREKQKGAESKLAPWISSLPESFGTPLTWPSNDLSELQYPHLEEMVEKQRREWTAFHSALMAASPGCGVSERDLSWAMGVAYSRAFSGSYEGRGPKERLAEVAFVVALAGGSVGLGLGTLDQVANGTLAVLIGIPLRDFFMTKLVQLKRYALIPVVDLINHKSDVQSDVSFNYFYGYFAATTQRGWEAGEQVFISYGQRSNDHLLQRYGFVEPDNPNDVYRVTGLVDKLSALLGEDSVKVLRGSGTSLGSEPVTSITVSRAGLVDEKEMVRVMPALRLAVVKDDQLPDGKMGSISLSDFSKEISPSNERAARGALRELCMKELEGLATSLNKDEYDLKSIGKSFGVNKRLAVAFRMEKKKVLDAAILAMKEGAIGGGDATKDTPPASSTAVAA